MSTDRTLLERAYELAKKLSTVIEIRKQLTGEGFDNAKAQLSSPTVRRTLKAIIKARKKDETLSESDKSQDRTD